MRKAVKVQISWRSATGIVLRDIIRSADWQNSPFKKMKSHTINPHGDGAGDEPPVAATCGDEEPM